MIEKRKYTIVLRSMETICNVVKQKILKGQQINAIQTIDESHDLYIRLIDRFGELKKLNQLLIDHYEEILDLCNSKHYELTTNRLKTEIKFLDDN